MNDIDNDYVNDEDTNDNECWSCLGTGEGYYEHSRCPVCNGKGYLLQQQEDYYEV